MWPRGRLIVLLTLLSTFQDFCIAEYDTFAARMFKVNPGEKVLYYCDKGAKCEIDSTRIALLNKDVKLDAQFDQCSRFIQCTAGSFFTKNGGDFDSDVFGFPQEVVVEEAPEFKHKIKNEKSEMRLVINGKFGDPMCNPGEDVFDYVKTNGKWHQYDYTKADDKKKDASSLSKMSLIFPSDPSCVIKFKDSEMLPSAKVANSQKMAAIMIVSNTYLPATGYPLNDGFVAIRPLLFSTARFQRLLKETPVAKNNMALGKGDKITQGTIDALYYEGVFQTNRGLFTYELDKTCEWFAIQPVGKESAAAPTPANLKPLGSVEEQFIRTEVHLHQNFVLQPRMSGAVPVRFQTNLKEREDVKVTVNLDRREIGIRTIYGENVVGEYGRMPGKEGLDVVVVFSSKDCLKGVEYHDYQMTNVYAWTWDKTKLPEPGTGDPKIKNPAYKSDIQAFERLGATAPVKLRVGSEIKAKPFKPTPVKTGIDGSANKGELTAAGDPYRVLKKTQGQLGWVIWAAFAGAILGLVIGSVLGGAFLYLCKKNFYAFWLRAMDNRYGSGATTGATTTSMSTMGGTTTGTSMMTGTTSPGTEVSQFNSNMITV